LAPTILRSLLAQLSLSRRSHFGRSVARLEPSGLPLKTILAGAYSRLQAN